MWYWIKSPDGEQNDYNLKELKLALGEGKIQPGSMGRRHNEEDWFPVHYLLEQDQDEEEGQHTPPAKYLALACGKCGNNLPIQLPIEEKNYHCPGCHTEYKATKVSDSPLTYVLMPKIK